MWRIDLHLYDESSNSKYDDIIDLLTELKEIVMSNADDVKVAMQALTDEVAGESTVVDSAVVLLDGIVARLDAAAGDPAKVQALRDSIKAQTDKLSAAVVANTPIPPQPVL